MPQKVKTGIASFGMSGLVFHGPLLYAHPEFEIKSILERHYEKSKGLYPSAAIVRSFDDLCGDSAIELIIVNTPDHTHYEYSRQALMAGKHVVVEKPFTLKTEEAEELVSLAEAKGLLLSVFQNRRWDGDFLTVKKIVEQGVLGRLVEFESHFDRYRNEVKNGSWKEDPENGTGTMYNLGSHLIDQALVLFGMPVGVRADIKAMRSEARVDDSFHVILDYPDIRVILRASYLVREPAPRFTLHGTNGSFVKWGLDPQEQALKDGLLPYQENWGKDQPEDFGLLNAGIGELDFKGRIETFPGNYEAYYDSVFRALRYGEPLAVPAEEGAKVIRVIEAAYRSAKDGGRKVEATEF